MPNADLSSVTPEECKDVSVKSKSKALLDAYRIAAEGHDLQYFKDMLVEHQEALNEDAERRAEKEAKKAEKTTKGRRKSEAAVAKEDDEMEVDEEVEAPKPKSKKRKKSLDSEDIEEKVSIHPLNTS
jgi:sRNA-binding protein